jgi:hypothetical protein
MHWLGWRTTVDISTPPGGATDTVPSWSDLKFNPLGLYNLRRRLGAVPDQPGAFMRHKHNFLHSDISWFAAGLHTDGQHVTPVDQFHILFQTAREHTGFGLHAHKLRNEVRNNVRDAVFDLVRPLILLFALC